MLDITEFKQLVERHWKYHAPASALLWRENMGGDSFQVEVAPAYQQVVGTKDDGLTVWAGFQFDLGGFLAERGVFSESVVASSYCVECSETPFIRVKGKYRGEAFDLRVHLEPVPGSAPAEAIDLINHRVRAIGEK